MNTEEKSGLGHWPVPSERNHIVMVTALSLLAGCRLSIYLEPGAWLWSLLLLGVGLGFLLRRAGRRMTAALILCAIAMGVMGAHARLWPVQPEPGQYEITGYVYGEPKLRSDQRISFTLTEVTLNGQPQPGRAYCSVHYENEPPVLFDGAELRFDGRVYLPDGKSGPPHFDFQMWMLQNGMHFGVAAYQEPEIANTREAAPWKDAAWRVREMLRGALDNTMGSEARLAMAMLLSDRKGLADEENEAFQTLGIAHIMSVSGLHVGLLGGILVLLLNKLRLRRAYHLLVVGLFLAAYCALTGFSAAASRAAAMLLLALIARIIGRRQDPLTTLGGAMIVVLLADPLQAFSAGFILSFAAVAGISLLFPVFLSALNRMLPLRERKAYARRSRARRLADALGRFLGVPREVLSFSLAAQLGVLLPTAAYFHQLPLYGVLINLVIVPFVGLLIPLYAAALLLSPLPFVGMGVGQVASAFSRLLLWAVELLATLPYASVRVPSPPAAIAMCGSLCILVASRRMRGNLGKRAVVIGLIVLLGLGGAYWTRPAQQRYIQLAVGQADAALLMDGNQTVAIDVGSDGMAVADYLLSEARDLDALYLTHLHQDHVSGVTDLLDRDIKIKQVYLPVNAAKQRIDPATLAVLERLRAADVPIQELARGEELRYNETAVRVLWPVRENVRAGQDANDLPLVLAIDFGGYTILSTSDLTQEYEAYAAAPCDVLKVAHHGSGASTSKAFLDFVRPDAALVSCSSGNAALPSPKTLQRLSEAGVKTWRTDEAGDVTLTIQDGRLCVTPYKERRSQ